MVKRFGIEKYSPLKLKTNIKQNEVEEKNTKIKNSMSKIAFY